VRTLVLIYPCVLISSLYKASGLQFPSYMSTLNLLEDATSSLGVSGKISLFYAT
jgi:hypothetical protein